jgi:glycosyltransferase involved in cell wall biosynthesis
MESLINKKIKVLLTIPNFDTAGSSKVLYDLAAGLDRDLFEVEIACKHNKGQFFIEVEKLGLPIHVVDFTIPYRPYFTLPLRIRKLVSFFKKHQYDLVHSWHWSSDWTEALAARLAFTPWVYTKKAMSWGNLHWKIRSKLASHIITINNEMKTFFPDKKNQSLIPLGLDLEYFKAIKVGVKDSSKFKVVSIANLVPVKGIEVLIRAVHSLANTNIELLVVGDDRDPYADYLKSLVADISASNIKFVGKHSDVRPFLSAADLYVIPTLDSGRKEGMPMALVEAMSMGVPVLGSNITGINYVLKDFPEFLFMAGNETELAKKIKAMMSRTERERIEIGTNLRLYCESNFSLEKFINAHTNLYNSLVRGK